MKNRIIYLVPFLAGLNGITLKIGGYNAKIDQLISIVIFLILIAEIIFSKQRLILDKPNILLIVFLLYSLVATILFAPDLNYSFMQTLSIISIVLIFFSMCNIISTDDQLTKFTRYFILAGVIYCTIGVLLFLLSKVGLINYGANLDDDPALPYGAYGTMVEPNIFGGYCLGYFVFSSMIIFTAEIPKRKMYYLLCVSFIGVFLSFTRGAWIAAVIGFLLVFIYSGNAKKVKLKRISFLIVCAVVLYLIISSFVSESYLFFKISNLIEADSGTGAYRLMVWNIALENIKNNLLFGTGTYSFATFTGDGTYDPRTNVWIGNTYITLLHDYGIIGFSLFILFLLSLIGGSILLMKKMNMNIESNDKWILFGLCFAVISLYIAFFFTMGNSLAYSWLYLGLIALYKRKLEADFNQEKLSIINN